MDTFAVNGRIGLTVFFDDFRPPGIFIRFGDVYAAIAKISAVILVPSSSSPETLPRSWSTGTGSSLNARRVHITSSELFSGITRQLLQQYPNRRHADFYRW